MTKKDLKKQALSDADSMRPFYSENRNSSKPTLFSCNSGKNEENRLVLRRLNYKQRTAENALGVREIGSLSFINSRLFARRESEFKEKHGSEGELLDLKRVKSQCNAAATYAQYSVQSTNRLLHSGILEAETRLQRLDLDSEVA